MSFDSYTYIFIGAAIIAISLLVLAILLCFEKRIYYEKDRIYDLTEVDVEEAKLMYSFPDVGEEIIGVTKTDAK